MDKKELINKVFDILYKSNLIFKKDGFQQELNGEMKLINYELAPETFDSLIKELISKDYLSKNEDFLIKSNLLLKKDKNKQTEYLSYLIEEYSQSFDVDYIHDEYVNNIVKSEIVPANFVNEVEYSYDIIKNYLIDKNFVKENKSTNQFEL